MTDSARRATDGAVDADSTNQILRGVVEGILRDHPDLTEDDELAREIVNGLRKDGWLRSRSERKRAVERNRRLESVDG